MLEITPNKFYKTKDFVDGKKTPGGYFYVVKIVAGRVYFVVSQSCARVAGTRSIMSVDYPEFIKFIDEEFNTMTENQKRITELFELVQEEGGSVDMNLPVRPVDAGWLFDLMTVFTRLDLEHQERAVSALNNVLADQIAEMKGVHKAI